MKKLLVCVLALLVSGAMYGQQEKLKKEVKQFIAFHAGPSVPLGAFGQTSLGSTNGSSGSIVDRESGFAKTGFTARVNYQYQLMENFGLSAAAFYNNHVANSAKFTEAINNSMGDLGISLSNFSLDHWKWYGITAGPVFTQTLAKNLAADVRVMGGAANVNCPKAVWEGIVMMDEDWAITPVFAAGAGLRFNTGSNMFIMVNADYQYMRPTFTVEAISEVNDNGTFNTEMVKAHQKIEVLNVSAGIGFRF